MAPWHPGTLTWTSHPATVHSLGPQELVKSDSWNIIEPATDVAEGVIEEELPSVVGVAHTLLSGVGHGVPLLEV